VRTLKTFQGTCILGASRGFLCDSYAVLLDQEVTHRNWSHIATRYLSCSCWGDLCSTWSKKPSLETESGRNLAEMFLAYIRIDWRSRIFDLTSHFQDGDHDVISHRKVLPPDEWTRSVYRAPFWHSMGICYFVSVKTENLLCRQTSIWRCFSRLKHRWRSKCWSRVVWCALQVCYENALYKFTFDIGCVDSSVNPDQLHRRQTFAAIHELLLAVS